MRCWAILAMSLVSAGSVAAQATQSYFYDVHGRLVSSNLAAGSSSGLSQYAYDPADSRNVRLRTGVNPPLVQNELAAYRGLLTEQELVSLDNRFRLRLQGDGNLVLYFGATALWSAATAGSQAMYLEMSGNGVLNLFPPSTAWATVWNSGVTGHPASKLVLQNDGNLVIYDGATPIWDTGTGGH